MRDMRVLLIGFGEAGRAIASGWREAELNVAVSAYDLKLDDSAARGEIIAAAGAAGVRTAIHAPGEFEAADHVFSLVTADQALAAARAAAPCLSPNQVYWDMNSAAPRTKRLAAEAVSAGGAEYLDVGILSPILPKRHRAPLAIAGRVDGRVRAAIKALDLDAGFLFEEIGQAAALKLLRSIVIKGVESALLECHLACSKTGLSGQVLGSLAPSFPGVDWPARSAYVLERTRTHGPRRAAEMDEVASYLEELGIDPIISRAAVKRLSDPG